MAPSFGGASHVGAYAKGSGRWRRAAELARHPRRGFFPFSPDGFGPPCAVRLTILPPSAAQVLSPSAAVVLCVGGSEADYQLTTGRTVVVRANPSSPRRRRRGAGESGGATATASPRAEHPYRRPGSVVDRGQTIALHSDRSPSPPSLLLCDPLGLRRSRFPFPPPSLLVVTR